MMIEAVKDVPYLNILCRAKIIWNGPFIDPSQQRSQFLVGSQLKTN